LISHLRFDVRYENLKFEMKRMLHKIGSLSME